MPVPTHRGSAVRRRHRRTVSLRIPQHVAPEATDAEGGGMYLARIDTAHCSPYRSGPQIPPPLVLWARGWAQKASPGVGGGCMSSIFFYFPLGFVLVLCAESILSRFTCPDSRYRVHTLTASDGPITLRGPRPRPVWASFSRTRQWVIGHSHIFTASSSSSPSFLVLFF